MKQALLTRIDLQQGFLPKHLFINLKPSVKAQNQNHYYDSL